MPDNNLTMLGTDFENAVEGIFQTTQDGHYINANPALASIYGYDSPQELIQGVTNIGQQIYVDPARRAEFKHIVEEKGQIRDYEYEAYRKDGTKIWVSQSARAVRDSKGKTLFYEGTTIDITRRKRAEEALQKTMADYRSIFENAVEGICRSTVDGKFLMVNPAFVRMLGYDSESELLQVDIPTQVYYDPADRLVFQKKIAEKGNVRSLELRFKKKNGELIFVNANDRVHKDENGDILYYEATIEDITERKRAEEALQRAHAELELRVKERTAELAKANEELRNEVFERIRSERARKESEERYRTLVELSPEVIAVLAQDRILYLNTAGAKFFGVGDPSELIGKHMRDVFHPRAAETIRHLVQRIEMQERGSLVQEKVMCRDGSLRFMEVSSAPIHYSGKSARLLIIRDISERKSAEEKLLSYQQQLQAMASQLALVQEEERRRMATYLHDDIGQALAVSKIKLKELSEDLGNRAGRRSVGPILELIEQAIQKTRSLTLDLSPPILYELGFESAVEWLADRFSERHNMKILYQNDREAKPLDDNVRVVLFQAVRELLVNVAKHADAKVVKLSIEKKDENIQMRIKDNGKGFDLSKIRSYDLKNSGFGLFNVRERLKHFGGRLEIHSTIGSGTCVTLLAPLQSSRLPMPEGRE